MMRSLITLFVSLLAVVAIGATSPANAIVNSIVIAPVALDGDVAGRPTDIVINLDTSLDPQVPGRTLLKGKSIEVTLPDAFINTGKLPVKDVFTEGCKPPKLAGHCSTAVLLQGWPQRPIRPPVKKYKLSLKGTHTLVFTALEDLTPKPPEEPGIKQMHLLLFGFNNPSPGRYPIKVVAETGPKGAAEEGTGEVEIVAKVRPLVSITSMLSEPKRLNSIYQETTINSAAPRPYDLLLWNVEGKSFEGVTIQDGKLTHGKDVIGTITIEAPKGATGQKVSAVAPAKARKSPVTAAPTAHLKAVFLAGSKPGTYKTTFAIKDGNSIQMIVRVK